MKGFLKRVVIGLGGAVTLMLAVTVYPQPLFAHSVEYGAFSIYSDRPISPAMARVISDAESRLKSSEFYRRDDNFQVFICTDPWRLFLLAKNVALGGMADPLTRNIYIREADAEANRLVIPSGVLADAQDRPLSYFIAHEAAHVMQSRRLGRFVSLRYPRWLVEGHADFVAKGGAFSTLGNRALLHQGDERLGSHFARRGLYRRYHLMVVSVLEAGTTETALFASPPPEEIALNLAYGRPELHSEPRSGRRIQAVR